MPPKLSAAGTNTATVLGGLGIAGLTIGFAARDALSNFISAILVYWDRPFVIGDLVEVGDNYGKVDQITLRSTRIITPDGRMLAVPNSEIINSTVASYTNFPHLRLDITATIGVNENIDRAWEVLLGLVEDHDRFMSRPAPRVVVTKLGDYSTEIQLQVWLDDEHEHVHWTPELEEQVLEVLTETGIHMPYETIQLAPHEVTVRQ